MVKYSLHSMLLLVLYQHTVIVADNDVLVGISDVCIDCLKRVQPSPDKECIPHPTLDALQCGPFKMTKGFYIDCKQYIDLTAPAWDTWEECYANDDCSRICVRAYHNHYRASCYDSLPQPRNLTCADFGQIHFRGPRSCGQEELVATDVIRNMSLLCGCQTVHGSRDECLVAPPCDQVEKGVCKVCTAAIVGVVCAAVLIVTGVVAGAVYCTHQKSKALIAHSDQTDVVSHSYRNHSSSNDVTNTTRQSNRLPDASNYHQKPFTIERDTLNENKFNDPRLFTSRPPSIEELNRPNTYAQSPESLTYSIHKVEVSADEITPEEIVTTGLEQTLDTGYVNITELNRDSALTLAEDTSPSKRAPIPVPRE